MDFQILLNHIADVAKKQDRLFVALLGDDEVHIVGAIPAIESEMKALVKRFELIESEETGRERRLTRLEEAQLRLGGLAIDLKEVRDRTWKNRLLIMAVAFMGGGFGGFLNFLLMG